MPSEQPQLKRAAADARTEEHPPLPAAFVHPSADVDARATIGPSTKIWHQSQIREHAVIGSECVLGKGVFIDVGVQIGDRCKLQNGVYVYHGFSVDDGVFLGPGAMLLNDRSPRAINPDGSVKSADDWTASEGHVGYGAAVGGGAILLPGITVGRFALIGSGAVVTRDVPDHALVYGNPARIAGFVCTCASPLRLERRDGQQVRMHCATCGRLVELSSADFDRAPAPA